MASVLFSWGVIFAASWIFGYGIVNVVYGRQRDLLGTLDIYLMFGLMFLGVYAEFFSLFYKVGIMACFILTVLGVFMFPGIIVSMKKKNDFRLFVGITHRGGEKEKKDEKWILIMVCVVIVATLLWTVKSPAHYDTSLYHVQSIMWIEEYGVVPGLGNLHNRFAYNSAFMPLQALFSFKWLTGQSLHTVNGYVCMLMSVYAIGSNNLMRGRKVLLSDLLKIGMLFYIFFNRTDISSPCSDILAMLLVFYICIKWMEYTEKQVDDALPYTCLCVLGIWAVTVKLSVASVILFAIWPAVLLIRKKQWKYMSANLAAGFLVALPWLARNVIISGYLLYPYPQIDIFPVDWKMPASVCTYDAMEIMVWGRDLKNVALYDLSIKQWFPIWLEGNNIPLIALGLAGGIGIIIRIFRDIVKRKRIDVRYGILFLYSLASLLMWLFSAPLLRYGMAYLLILICEAAHLVLEHHKLQSASRQYRMRWLLTAILVPAYCVYISSWGSVNGAPVWMQANYVWKLTDSMEIGDGVRVWYPVEGDQSSYDVFPCAPYVSMIKKLELRGEGLADGFRIKPEYGDLRLTGYGTEW